MLYSGAKGTMTPDHAPHPTVAGPAAGSAGEDVFRPWARTPFRRRRKTSARRRTGVLLVTSTDGMRHVPLDSSAGWTTTGR